MGRNKVSARERIEQYKNHGLYATDGNTVFCKYCSCSLSWEKKDTLEKHVASSKHLKKKNNYTDRRVQTSLVEVANSTKRRKLDSDYFSKKTVEAFTKANIPLEKLENVALREWIEEFTNGGGDLACVKTLREKYVPEIAAEFVQSTTAALEGKALYILCDETTDRVGHCVFVVIFHVPECSDEKLFVASISFLDACNATTCSRAVLDAMRKYNIDYDNVLAFVSDGVRYMTSCFETLKVVVGDHLLHIQCWAHKLNLVGNSWTMEMSDLNNLVSAVKSAFFNTRKRKNRYLNFLEEKHEGNKPPRLFPSPVLTRWNSWFEADFYLADYFTDVVEFFKLPEMMEIANSGINFVSHLTNKQVSSLHAQAIFVKEHAKDLVELVTFLEGSKYLTSHILYLKLNNLDLSLEEIERGKLLPDTKVALSAVSAGEKASVETIFKKAAFSARHKLDKLKSSDPARNHFQNIAHAFSPTKLVFNSDEEEAGLKNLPGFSKLHQTDISRGYRAMKEFAEIQIKKGEKVDVEGILHTVSAEYPEFVKCCFRLLSTPTNNVDSERLLSHYNNVVTDRRTKLKEQNVEIFTALSFGCSNGCH